MTLIMTLACLGAFQVSLSYAQGCSSVFVPNISSMVEFTFDQSQGAYYDFQSIKVHLAVRAQNLLACPSELAKIVLRYREANDKKWSHRQVLDPGSRQLVLKDGIQACTNYEFQLRAKTEPYGRMRNSRIGHFTTGPRPLESDDVVITLQGTSLELDWSRYQSPCLQAVSVTFGGQKKTVDAGSSSKTTLTLKPCADQAFLVSPMFKDREGGARLLRAQPLPNTIDLSAEILPGALAWKTDLFQACPAVVKMDLEFYLTHSESNDPQRILSKEVQFFDVGPYQLSLEEIFEYGTREGVIAPCQIQSLDWNVTLHGGSHQEEELIVLHGVPISVDHLGNVSFSSVMDPQCEISHGIDRLSKAIVEADSALGSTTDPLDKIEAILGMDRVSTAMEMTERTSVPTHLVTETPTPVNTTVSGASEGGSSSTSTTNVTALPDLATRATGHMPTPVTSSTSNSSTQATYDDHGIDRSTQTFTSSSPSTSPTTTIQTSTGIIETTEENLSTAEIESAQEDTDYEELEVIDSEDTTHDNDGSVTLIPSDYTEAYDTYDHVEPETSNVPENSSEPDSTTSRLSTKPSTVDTLEERVVSITASSVIDAAENGDPSDEAIVVHSNIDESSISSTLVIVVVAGFVFLLAAFFFGVATYRNLKKSNGGDVIPEWESPIVKQPFQLTSTSSESPALIQNEHSTLSTDF